MPFSSNVGADLLSSSAMPSRLVCRRGRWALELTRLVAVDSHVFQPRKQRLEGSDAILSHLKRNEGGLAQAAAQLMRSTRSDEERSFDAVDGEWVPTNGNAPVDMYSDRRQSGHDLESAFAELRAEFLLLRASHQRLKERVISLEARLANGAVAVPSKAAPAVSAKSFTRISLSPGGAVSEPAAAPAVVLPAALASQPAPTPTLATGQAPPAAPAPPVGGVVAAAGKASLQPNRRISASSETDLLGALKDLFGGDPGYAKSDEPVPDSALELAALYASLLVDDDGNELGAVLADIRATANLGGRLVGLPATVIDEQAKTGVLSESVTAAMSEVCNTLSAVLSRTPQNGQLRSTPLESFPPDRLRWVGSARSVVAFEKRRAGTFWLVTR